MDAYKENSYFTTSKIVTTITTYTQGVTFERVGSFLKGLDAFFNKDLTLKRNISLEQVTHLLGDCYFLIKKQQHISKGDTEVFMMFDRFSQQYVLENYLLDTMISWVDITQPYKVKMHPQQIKVRSLFEENLYLMRRSGDDIRDKKILTAIVVALLYQEDQLTKRFTGPMSELVEPLLSISERSLVSLYVSGKKN
jgi:hypothetical protein